MMHRVFTRGIAFLSAMSIATSPIAGFAKEPFTYPILNALENVESGTMTTELSFAIEPLEADVMPIMDIGTGSFFNAAGIFDQAEHLVVSEFTEPVAEVTSWDATEGDWISDEEYWTDETTWSEDDFMYTYEEPSIAEQLAQVNFSLTSRQNFNKNKAGYSDGSFSVELGLLGENIALSGKTANRGEDAYIQFSNVSIGGELPEGVPDGVIGDWFSIEAPELPKTIFEPENEQSSDLLEDPAAMLGSLTEVSTQITDIIDDLARIDALEVVNKYRTITGGKKVTIYTLNIDAEKAATIAPEDLSMIAPLLGNTTLKLTVQDRTNIPVAMDFAIRIALSDLDEVSTGQQVALRGSVTLTEIGRNFTYESIKDARPFAELDATTVVAEPEVEQQYVYITDLQWALDTYFYYYGYYPESLDKLLEGPIPTDWSEDMVVHFVPNDVFTNMPYTYEVTEESYELQYFIELSGDSTWSYSFVQGTNTATAYSISLESDAAWYEEWDYEEWSDDTWETWE